MVERLVDVLSSNKTVLHTFPVTVRGSNVVHQNAEYEEKALKAAAHAQLVPDAELGSLTTRMHVCRSGALTPYGDHRDVLSQTQAGLEQVVRERAYFLWQRDGCPQGRAEEHWRRVQDFEAN